MKYLLLLLLLPLWLMSGAAVKHNAAHPPVKGDTIRDIKNQRKPVVVKGRSARMRMQLRQIRRHEQQRKKIDKAEKEVEQAQQRHGEQ